MAISGYDLLKSLEAAIAAKYSALWGSIPLSLPLEDRSLTLYPSLYRWYGGDYFGIRQRILRAVPISWRKGLNMRLTTKKLSQNGKSPLATEPQECARKL